MVLHHDMLIVEPWRKLARCMTCDLPDGIAWSEPITVKDFPTPGQSMRFEPSGKSGKTKWLYESFLTGWKLIIVQSPSTKRGGDRPRERTN